MNLDLVAGGGRAIIVVFLVRTIDTDDRDGYSVGTVRLRGHADGQSHRLDGTQQKKSKGAQALARHRERDATECEQKRRRGRCVRAPSARSEGAWAPASWRPLQGAAPVLISDRCDLVVEAMACVGSGLDARDARPDERTTDERSATTRGTTGCAQGLGSNV